MAEIKANGDELINCGEEIISLTEQYVTEINNLFEVLNKITRTAWSGDSADVYAGKLPKDQKQLLSFGEYLQMYGIVVKNTGKNINKMVTKWEDV